MHNRVEMWWLVSSAVLRTLRPLDANLGWLGDPEALALGLRLELVQHLEITTDGLIVAAVLDHLVVRHLRALLVEHVVEALLCASHHVIEALPHLAEVKAARHLRRHRMARARCALHVHRGGHVAQRGRCKHSDHRGCASA